MDLFYFVDIAGTFVFAISGALAAEEKRLDAFGVTLVAFVTAVGGGTSRDILLDLHPLRWISDRNYLFSVLCAVAITYFFRRYIAPLRKTLMLFDTLGLGLFTVMGLEKALTQAHLGPVAAVMMGMVSATFGGVIRDVLCNEIPVIFRREIYATACLSGAAVYMLLLRFFPDGSVSAWAGASVVIILRVLAVRYKLSLPWNRPFIKPD